MGFEFVGQGAWSALICSIDLAAGTGDGRCVLRDFVMGLTELAEKTP